MADGIGSLLWRHPWFPGIKSANIAPCRSYSKVQNLPESASVRALKIVDFHCISLWVEDTNCCIIDVVSYL